MLLTDLFRYRTRKNEQMENFASTALAGLIQRDPAAAEAILRLFDDGSWSFPENLEALQVQTQDRAWVGDQKAIPDIVVRTGTMSLCIECKIEAPLDLTQIELYKGLDMDKVVVLAKSASLASQATDPAWNEVPKTSWEKVWRALHRLRRQEPSHDPVAAWLRLAVMDLLAHLNLAMEADLTGSEVWRAVNATRRLSAVQAHLRSAVLSLLADGAVTVDDDDEEHGWIAGWEDAEPLDATWIRERPAKKDKVRLTGLGLVASRTEGTVRDSLTWTLWVRPGKGMKSVVKKARRDEECFTKNVLNNGWWWVELADAPLEKTSFAEVTDIAIEDARAWLRLLDGLPVATAPWHPAVGTQELREFVEELTVAEEASRLLQAWQRRLRRELQLSLQGVGTDTEGKRPTLTAVQDRGLDVRPGTVYLYLEEPGQKERGLWWEFSHDLGVKQPYMQVIMVCGAYQVARDEWCKRAKKALKKVLMPQGVRLKRTGAGWVRFRVRLLEHPPQEAVPMLVDAVVRFLSSDVDALLPPFGEEDA